MTPPILELRNVYVSFPIATGFIGRTAGRVNAVRGVNLTLAKGEALALVGESGSGKTTLARLLVRLSTPTMGEVFYNGTDITRLTAAEERDYRLRVQIVFQDPYDSLDPKMNVGSIVAEGMDIHGLVESAERKDRIAHLLHQVDLPTNIATRYPRDLSGGQRQRVAIARALAVDPEVLVLDEPFSALDVSVQAQIMRLLDRLRETQDLTYLLIAHDLAAVPQVCNRIAVMYLGKIIETGDSEAVIGSPLHPYTQALVSAAPIPDPAIEATRKRIVIEGEIPSVLTPPLGCSFHTRCPVAQDICVSEEPRLEPLDANRSASCHFVGMGPGGPYGPDVRNLAATGGEKSESSTTPI